MIIHTHGDGSQGFEYQLGDTVKINRTIPGGWFSHCAGKTGTITRIRWHKNNPANWRTAELDVRHSPDWGPASCFPWMVEPAEDCPIAVELFV